MLHELNGDILFSSAKAIVQGVAPNDDFHQGLALQLRERMPAMYKDFRHYCQTKHPKSGELWNWMSADGRYLINLFTQDAAYAHGSKPGNASLQHINHSLHALRGVVQKEKIGSLALPRLACGVGGLSWDDVKPLIEKHLGDLNIPVYIYVNYQKGVKATEPRNNPTELRKSSMSDKIDNVSVGKKANVFFDGKCVSHSVFFPDGSRKTVGVVLPNSQLTFNVGVPELMEITAGSCSVKIAGESAFKTYAAGTNFKVAENSSFDIHTGADAVDYVCSFG